MKSNNKMYKTISGEELNKLKIKVGRKYYYFAETDLKEIKEQNFKNHSNEKVYQLIDDDYEWNPKVDILNLDLELSIQNCNVIFGKNGSCYRDSIIGIGLSWKPEKSRIKRCIKIGEFCAKDSIKEFKVNKIELQNLSSNCSFKLFFYIVKPGTIDGNPYFGNDQGLIIHEQILWSIVIDGSGSFFPIYEIEDENGPLWYFTCDFDDICEDYFNDDHIQVLINKNHSLYPVIHPKSNQYNATILNEVMSSAVTCIIMAIRSKLQNNKVDLSLDYERGSILQALVYFSEKLNFKINDSYENLLISIKMFFDKEY